MKLVCIATIGTILGIIMGLYLKSIVLFILINIFFIILCAIIKKYFKYIFTFCICLILFYTYTTILENRYCNIIKTYDKQDLQIRGIIISSPQDNEYKKTYKLHVLQIKNINTGEIKKNEFNILCNIKKLDTNITFEYGDEIVVLANFEAPSISKNYGGFNYRQYLKIKQIAGSITVKENDVNIISKNRNSFLKTVIYNIKKYLIEQINKILPQNEAGLCISIILGSKDELSEDIQENFRKSNLSHMLAISGAHITYLLLAITTLVKYLNLHKRWSKLFVIIFLIFFMALTGFTPSVTRACIMSILNLLAEILFRKSNIYSNLAISCFIILLFNPYSILDIGFQLSYGGTIGIVLFCNKLFKHNLKSIDLKNTKINKYIKKIGDYIKQIIIVALSTNLMIFPIIMYHFNTLSLTFFISNLLAFPILGICIILSITLIVIIIIINPLAHFFSYFIQPFLNFLIHIGNISSKLPFSQVLVPTPKIWQIILYYILIIYIILIKKYRHILKFENKKIISSIIIFTLFFSYIFPIFPVHKLEIHFIDVGQGDSTLIITDTNKRVLIDGGGSEMGNFDVGRKILLPYLLDKGIMKIDYILFTHFDSDHCEGLFTILENIKVKNVIISKQAKTSSNFETFLKIIKNKKVKVLVVQAGDKIKIDKNSCLDILFPTSNLISTNALNNNSIVAKFNYNNELSILFTGDIEEIAERKILEKYKNSEILKSTILKVAHHGSKTSSIKEFLEAVKPKIALIGVGEKNTFGHPNVNTLKRLEDLRFKDI